MAEDKNQVARQILAGLFDAAALLDEELRLLEVNDPFLQLSGLNRRLLQKRIQNGATLLELFVTESASVAESFRAAWQSRRPVRMAEVPLRLGEETILVWLAFIPLLDGDACYAVQLVLRDVTAEARMQRNFRQLLDESQARAQDLERKVAERTVELQSLLQEVTRLSRVDPLTGALNRRALTEFSEHALAMAARGKRSVGLLMCDLDFFKKVNDVHGHTAGDAILVATADALARNVRSTDRVARLGGEEFVVFLTETSREAVLEVGQRCCAAIRQLPFAELVPGKEGPQTVSIGVAVFPEHGETLEVLIRLADEALYQAKRGGRDRVVIATSPGQ